MNNLRISMGKKFKSNVINNKMHVVPYLKIYFLSLNVEVH